MASYSLQNGVNLDPSKRAEHVDAPPSVLLHSIVGTAGSTLARRLEQTCASYGKLRPLVGPFPRPIVQLSGPDGLLRDAGRGLPDGAATPEAIAVRLRRDGVDLAWGAPVKVRDLASFLRLCRARGASSVELVRADPSLVTELQLGAFFHAYWRTRVLRRAACLIGSWSARALASGSLMGIAADTAFWQGARSVATKREWERLTKSSYIVVYYHRIAGEQSPGQDHLDIRPSKFDRQQRLLRLLGFRALSPEELLHFHNDPNATLRGRRYILTADDGIRDAVEVFGRNGDLRPQMFVCTSSVGGKAWWIDNEPIATWEELRQAQVAGVVIGSHARDHTALPVHGPDDLGDELSGSLRDLQSNLPHVSALLAYPHGRHDERVRAAAIAAGYRAAFTTEPGRNGAGTDVYCLRRLGLKDWDGPAALMWKTLTGELLPWQWERWRQRLRSARASRKAARTPRASDPN